MDTNCRGATKVPSLRKTTRKRKYSEDASSNTIATTANNNAKKSRSPSLSPPVVPAPPDPVYVDKCGKQWHFVAQLTTNLNDNTGNNNEQNDVPAENNNNEMEEKQQLLRQFFYQNSFYIGNKSRTTYNLLCKRSKGPCHNKPPYCEVRGIFVKASRALYTRNEHTHPLGEEVPPPAFDPVKDGIHVDRIGKHWHLIEQARDEEHLMRELRHQHWLVPDGKYKTTINFACKRAWRCNSKCHFRGLYVREKMCLYANGKHNHSIIINADDKFRTLKKKNRDNKVIEDQEENNDMNGLGGGEEDVAETAQLMNNGQGKKTGNSSKRNVVATNPVEAGVYVDRMGKHWHLIGQARDEKHLMQKLRHQHSLHRDCINKTTYNFCCVTNLHRSVSNKCPFRAVYVLGTKCLYGHGKHNHPTIVAGNGTLKREEGYAEAIQNAVRNKHGSSNVPLCGTRKKRKNCLEPVDDDVDIKREIPMPTPDPVYIDQYGKRWQFLAQFIDKNNIGKQQGANNNNKENNKMEEKQQLLRQFFHRNSFYKDKEYDKAINLMCKRTKSLCKKPPYCTVRGIFVKATGALYTCTEHTHPLVVEEKPLGVCDTIKDGIYVDRLGKNWRLIGQARDEQHMMGELRHQHFLFADANGKATINFQCRKYQRTRCPFRGLYLKGTMCLYAHGEHNHPMPTAAADISTIDIVQKMPKLSEIGRIYVDHYGKHWRLVAQVWNNEQMRKLSQQHLLNQICNNKTTINFRCKKCCTASKCPYRALYVRETMCLYAYGEHNHPLSTDNAVVSKIDIVMEKMGKMPKIPEICLFTLTKAAWCAERSDPNVEIEGGGLKAVVKKCSPPNSYFELFTQSPFDLVDTRAALATGFTAFHYFEVEILEMSETNDVYIGFASEANCPSCYVEFAAGGYRKCQFGEDDDAEWMEFGTRFTKGNVVGCGLVMQPPNGKCAFAFLTVNGIASEHVAVDGNGFQQVWPFTVLGTKGTEVKANFGENQGKNPFKHNPWRHPFSIVPS